MRTITVLRDGLLLFFRIYYYILFGRIVLSLFQVGLHQNSLGAKAYQILYGLTEPLLAPIRGLLPAIRMGAGFLDLSPVILLILLQMLERLVYVYLY